MDPLGDPLTTHPIQTGWEFSIELCTSGQFRFIDDPDPQFGNGLVRTQTQTRSHGSEPLLTLPICHKASLSDIENLCQDILAITAAFAGLTLKFRCT
jgi:hypothetical protein